MRKFKLLKKNYNNHQLKERVFLLQFNTQQISIFRNKTNFHEYINVVYAREKEKITQINIINTHIKICETQ